MNSLNPNLMAARNAYAQAGGADNHVQTQRQKKIGDMANEFEAIFLNNVLSQMSAGLKTEETVMGGGQAETMWRQMLNEQMAEHISKGKGIGISDTIEKQLLKIQEGR